MSSISRITHAVPRVTSDGRKAPVIWRKLPGEAEQDNLENLKTPDNTWKVWLIEEDFHRLMIEIEGVRRARAEVNCGKVVSLQHVKNAQKGDAVDTC